MQAQNWSLEKDFRAMLAAVGAAPHARRMRLAACGAVRSVWGRIDHTSFRAAVETAEEFADSRASRQQLEGARQAVAATVAEFRLRVIRDPGSIPELASLETDYADLWPQRMGAIGAVRRTAELIEMVLDTGAADAALLYRVTEHVWEFKGRDISAFPEDWAARCELLRDIFGNPFRPVAFDPSWRTSTVVALARQMYDARDFSLLPILADALQDAGCADAAVLAHCRGGGPHVRGCWVVDLVLGKG